MLTLENEFLKIIVSPKGAELQSLFDKTTQNEWLWQGDSNFWGKRAPFLFPFIGALKEGVYTYAGTTYAMTKHGFARDMTFTGETLSESHLQFTLTHSESSLAMYPFPFALVVDYRLKIRKLEVSMTVINQASQPMIFSIGGHPAFNCPMDDESWQLVFDEVEHLKTKGIHLETGLILAEDRILLESAKKLPLTSQLFKNDALVFEGLKSAGMLLEQTEGSKRLRFEWFGLPIIALWSSCGPFICLEPWLGMADLVDSNSRLEEKYGALSIEGGAKYTCGYSMAIQS